MKWGPTSANSSPARFVWVRSAEAKEKLAALAMDKNQQKIRDAPLTVIIGNDLAFADALPKLLPHNAEAMQKAFADPQMAAATAARNATLQGAYLIIAARALGLDCGPMSGFNNAAVDQAFFAGTRIQSTFICCLGTGDPASTKPGILRDGWPPSGKLAGGRACARATGRRRARQLPGGRAGVSGRA